MASLSELALWSGSALVGIWLGYPLVIASLAAARRLRQRPECDPTAPAPPTVSIIIATRERSERIAHRVADLLAANYPRDRMEIVISLDRQVGGAGLLPPVASERVRVVVGDEPGGKAATLNAAIRAARGEVLVFTDVSQRFDPDAIAKLVAPLENTRVGAVSGLLDIAREPRTLPSPAESYWLMERWLREREAIVHSTVGVTGAIYALRRALWVPMPAGLILDDVYAPMQVVLAGFRVAFARDARAYDARRFKPEQEYRRKVRTLTGILQLCAWLPEVLVPVRNPIWPQFVAHKLLRLLTPYLCIATAVGFLGTVITQKRLADPVFSLALLGVGGAVVWQPRGRDRLRRALGWSVVAQAAFVVALANGLRGRWDVWR